MVRLATQYAQPTKRWEPPSTNTNAPRKSLVLQQTTGDIALQAAAAVAAMNERRQNGNSALNKLLKNENQTAAPGPASSPQQSEYVDITAGMATGGISLTQHMQMQSNSNMHRGISSAQSVQLPNNSNTGNMQGGGMSLMQHMQSQNNSNIHRGMSSAQSVQLPNNSNHMQEGGMSLTQHMQTQSNSHMHRGMSSAQSVQLPNNSQMQGMSPMHPYNPQSAVAPQQQPQGHATMMIGNQSFTHQPQPTHSSMTPPANQYSQQPQHTAAPQSAPSPHESNVAGVHANPETPQDRSQSWKGPQSTLELSSSLAEQRLVVTGLQSLLTESLTMMDALNKEELQLEEELKVEQDRTTELYDAQELPTDPSLYSPSARVQTSVDQLDSIRTKRIELEQTLREEEDTTMELSDEKRKLDTEKKHLQNRNTLMGHTEARMRSNHATLDGVDFVQTLVQMTWLIQMEIKQTDRSNTPMTGMYELQTFLKLVAQKSKEWKQRLLLHIEGNDERVENAKKNFNVSKQLREIAEILMEENQSLADSSREYISDHSYHSARPTRLKRESSVRSLQKNSSAPHNRRREVGTNSHFRR